MRLAGGDHLPARDLDGWMRADQAAAPAVPAASVPEFSMKSRRFSSSVMVSSPKLGR